MPGRLLVCPIRGQLNVPERASDGLIFTEEKRRIDCIRFLLNRGFPREHFKIETTLLRFGNAGRNSFRTDLVVTDVPISTIHSGVDSLLPHIKLIAEIKRDNSDLEEAIRTQVKPAMSFVSDISAFGIYWDDVEQRLFYHTMAGTRILTHEAVINVLPRWGQRLTSPTLKKGNLSTTTELLGLFVKIENALHSEVTDKSRRFEIILQILLCKIYDEFTHQNPDDVLIVQDFKDAPLGEIQVKNIFNTLLENAGNYYNRYLPNPVSREFSITGTKLREISAIIAPICIRDSKRDIVQDFYMYFAKSLYKWDLAQYFTPNEVIDFIVTITNPKLGDQIKDPACGSGDFLISAFKLAGERGQNLSDSVWGTDNSDNAVQVSILNMVLNGDGKSNIRKADSLLTIGAESDRYSLILCNPPFGVKIKETRLDVLSQFDLAHVWNQGETRRILTMSDDVVPELETGLLFAELCIRQARPGGRIAIILPNGYLGNRSQKYQIFREWLLRNAILVAVVAFPRFTFKKSGADVSASVLILEKRRIALTSSRDSTSYPFYVGIIEKVGWSVSDKTAKRIYKRAPEDGSIIVDDRNEPIPDADFDRVLREIYSSSVANLYPWLTVGLSDLPTDGESGYTVNMSSVMARDDISIDPKLWSERAAKVREEIQSIPSIALNEIVTNTPASGFRKVKSRDYDYVEIQDVLDGVINPTQRKGWDLPDRAKHRADAGDVFIGGIWNSVNKWFIAGGDCSNIIVSNGFYRLKMIPGKEQHLPDLIAALNTEAYRIQMRSLATGSDGLAEIPISSLLELRIPIIQDPEARRYLEETAQSLIQGRANISRKITELMRDGRIPKTNSTTRSNNYVQV